MKLERITEQQIRDAIAKLQPDKCQYDYESVANCQRDADQKVVDELEFFIEQLKATNATLIQQTSEYGREYLKAEAKVKALEDAHYELALSTNKIIRELNAQIEALEEKLRALIVIITNYGRA